MCRIAGIFNPGSANLSGEIAAMTDAMRRGGPDDEGVYLDRSFPLAFGHRRLSIIDLTPGGHQPMADGDGRYQLVFNGEIYNYRELRQELERAGHRFGSESDTEVILKAYQAWGMDCFSRFNGMFALALFDRASYEIILARDHAGIKPLYYYLDGGRFYFASEVRAFRQSGLEFPEDPDWKALFLAFGHIPEPFTTLRSVRMLERGCSMRVSLPGLLSEKQRFVRLEFSDEIRDLDEACGLVRETLENAVRRHLIADAPLGIFLSGGIDSSSLALLAAPMVDRSITTLFLDFEETRFSERPYRDIVTGKIPGDHRAATITQEDFDFRMPDVLRAMDQPTVDGINSYFVSMFARSAGLKAVLAGHGADELFGGYTSFGTASRYRALAMMPASLLDILGRAGDSRIRKMSYAAMDTPVGEYLVYRGIFTPRSIAKITGFYLREVQDILSEVQVPASVASLPDVNRVSFLETELFLKNQLLKDTDYMSMWHGLEIRVPYLDLELMRLMYRISPAIKLDRKTPKHLLVRAMGKDLPDAIWNRPKQGFTFPFADWMKDAEFTKPQYPHETQLHDEFTGGRLPWGRYWCALLVNRFYRMGAAA